MCADVCDHCTHEELEMLFFVGYVRDVQLYKLLKYGTI